MKHELNILLANLDELEDDNDFEELSISLDAVEDNLLVFKQAMTIHEDNIIQQISTHDTHFEFCLN